MTDLKPGELGYRNQEAEKYCRIDDEFKAIRKEIAETLGRGSDQGVGWIDKWMITKAIEDLIDEKIIFALNAIADRIEDAVGGRP